MYFHSSLKLTKSVLDIEVSVRPVYYWYSDINCHPEERMIHTASSLNAWLRCNRYHEFAYRLTYRPTRLSKALEVGTAAHMGINEFWRKGNETCAMSALNEHISSAEFFATEQGEIEAA